MLRPSQIRSEQTTVPCTTLQCSACLPPLHLHARGCRVQWSSDPHGEKGPSSLALREILKWPSRPTTLLCHGRTTTVYSTSSSQELYIVDQDPARDACVHPVARFSPIATLNLCQCTSDLPSCDCEWYKLDPEPLRSHELGWRREFRHSNRFGTKHYPTDWLLTLSYSESTCTLILFGRLFSYMQIEYMDHMGRCKINYFEAIWLYLRVRQKRSRLTGQTLCKLAARATNQSSGTWTLQRGRYKDRGSPYMMQFKVLLRTPMQGMSFRGCSSVPKFT